MSWTMAARGGSGVLRHCPIRASICPRRRRTVATRSRAKARSRAGNPVISPLSSIASSSGRLRRRTAPIRSIATLRAVGGEVDMAEGADKELSQKFRLLTPANAVTEPSFPPVERRRRDISAASRVRGKARRDGRQPLRSFLSDCGAGQADYVAGQAVPRYRRGICRGLLAKRPDPASRFCKVLASVIAGPPGGRGQALEIQKRGVIFFR